MPPTSPTLNSFPTGTQPMPEQFGHALRSPDIRTLHCTCEPQHREAVEIYARVLGVRSKLHITEVSGGIPYEALAEENSAGVVPLFVDSATNPDLPNRYFGTPRVASFVDHQYIRDPDGADALTLRTIGTTAHGLRQAKTVSNRLSASALERERSERTKAVIGSDIVTNHDLRQILASPAVEQVRLHALGPQGTNIAQASDLYLRNVGIRDKSDLVVHPRGITPMQYVELAAAEKRAGVVPLHMECAVYFGMPKLYQDRVRERMELLFVDHQYMPLDEMQLAALENTGGNGRPRVATHGSPKPLMRPWIEGDSSYAEWVDATSNAAAADMVRNREVEYCITTESGRIGTGDQQPLKKIHSFGSPMMVFTLGTPYTQAELRSLRT